MEAFRNNLFVGLLKVIKSWEVVFEQFDLRYGIQTVSVTRRSSIHSLMLIVSPISLLCNKWIVIFLLSFPNRGCPVLLIMLNTLGGLGAVQKTRTLWERDCVINGEADEDRSRENWSINKRWSRTNSDLTSRLMDYASMFVLLPYISITSISPFKESLSPGLITQIIYVHSREAREATGNFCEKTTVDQQMMRSSDVTILFNTFITLREKILYKYRRILFSV